MKCFPHRYIPNPRIQYCHPFLAVSGHVNVMNVSYCCFNRHYCTCPSVYPDISFHSKTPFLPFLRWVQLLIANMRYVLCRAWRIDDRCVYDLSRFIHQTLDRVKYDFEQIVLFQQMSKMLQRSCIWRLLFNKIVPYEFVNGIAILDCILNAFVK